RAGGDEGRATESTPRPTGRRRGGGGSRSRDQGQRRQREGKVDHEDGAPAGDIDQDPAEQGPDGRSYPDAGGEDAEGAAAMVLTHHGTKRGLSSGNEGGAEGGLDAAGHEEGTERRRQAGADRRQRESPQRARCHAPDADLVGQAPGEGLKAEHRHQVRGDEAGGGPARDMKVACDLGKADRDHGGVERDQRGAADGAEEGAPLGAVERDAPRLFGYRQVISPLSPSTTTVAPSGISAVPSRVPTTAGMPNSLAM